MALRLGDDHSELVRGVDPELRVAAEALGMGLRAELVRLAPALTRAPDGDAPGGVLVSLDLDREGAPDALSLSACLAAHRAYVIARGDADAISTGALALARLLVWAQRAAMLGPAPRIEWIGPAPRRPEPEGRFALAARAAIEVGGGTRRAEAVALLRPPAGGGLTARQSRNSRRRSVSR